MPVTIKITTNAKEMRRALSDFARKQVPFAAATALNAVAQKIIAGETEALSEVFDSPKAFTKSAFTQSPAFGGQYASKRNLTAVVAAKPTQAVYLAPAEFDEPQSLGKGKRIRTPVNVRTGAGGNLAKGAIQRLLARPDVFMGEVHGINGIWQRPKRGIPRGRGYGTKGKHSNIGGSGTTLKLLVAFTRPVKIKTKLGYRERAATIVQKHFDGAFEAALQRALATAK
jgi:hypothetical protein